MTANKQFSAFFNNTVIQGQSGSTAGEAELNALLDMIMANDEVSRFMCRNIYRFFVHGEIDAATETSVIEPLAQIFRDNQNAPDQMRIVMRALLTSDHFFGEAYASWVCHAGPATVEAQYHVWRDVLAYDLRRAESPESTECGGLPSLLPVPSLRRHLARLATYPARNNSLLGILYTGFSTPANLYQPEAATSPSSPICGGAGGAVHQPRQSDALVSDAADLMLALPISLPGGTRPKTPACCWAN
ncbi:MAG: DUF1800 family protein [Flavobacteriales bacterium]|nr:DUF1800 family protein [Flavobacteriales bacterium]